MTAAKIVIYLVPGLTVLLCVACYALGLSQGWARREDAMATRRRSPVPDKNTPGWINPGQRRNGYSFGMESNGCLETAREEADKLLLQPGAIPDLRPPECRKFVAQFALGKEHEITRAGRRVVEGFARSRNEAEKEAQDLLDAQSKLNSERLDYEHP